MYPVYYGIIIAVSLIALISTISIARNQSKNEASSTKEDTENLMSKNKGSSIPLLTTIYSIFFAVTIILIAIFIF
ncbi:hypothetical protein H0266_15920 [Halobacillus locisalis]|uniref:Uncharacterized protein n=1 Tax=Halobacillus locisalis TaxID=220753 RepID=A0A838CX93_9BACI|nr:hypothetical protein [Halobacillus locisalis]MBA2176385.1 hypothetical protein [Halobacillus locisalis]